MKILVEINNLNNLELNQADGLIFNRIFLSDTHEGFLLDDEVKSLVGFCNNNDKHAIANVNRIFTEGEFSQAISEIEQLLSLGVKHFMFSDLGIFKYLKEKGLTENLIYNARTMITNYGDLEIWKSLGVLAAFISNEISLEDITRISTVGIGALNVYGYHQIFYSKRNLVTLYFENRNKEGNYKNKRFDILEEKRNERYPITESEYGTYVYSPYRYAIFSELSKLKNLKFILISNKFMNDDDLITVVNIYKQGLRIGFSEELLNKLKQIDDNIHPGFLYQKTVLRKGEEQ